LSGEGAIGQSGGCRRLHRSGGSDGIDWG
jgi:hypothetical protein